MQHNMIKQSSLLSSAATLVFTVISTTHGAFNATPRHILQRSRPTKRFVTSSLLHHQEQQRRQSNIPNPLISSFPLKQIYTHPRVGTVRSWDDKVSLTTMSSTSRTAQETLTQNQGILIDEQEVMILPYVEGSHNSVKIVISESNENDFSNMDKNTFKERLQATINACVQLKKSSLWISIPMSYGRFTESMNDIPGLEYHNANGKNANLCIWLSQNIENKIPEYATHQVGVGAIVVNSRDEILCVRELKRNYRPWKIPGGLAELGENLDTAAIREVKEETGIDCTFKSVLTFRHTHGMQFNRSDFYFVCRLDPIESVDGESGEVIIPEPVAQAGEIAAVGWVPFHEYRAMVNDGENPHPMMQKVLEVYDSGKDIQKSVISSIVPGRQPSPIYHAP